MSKPLAQAVATKAIKKSILGLIGAFLSGKLALAAGAVLVLLAMLISVVSIPQMLLSKLRLPCIFGCGSSYSGNISKIGQNEIPSQYLDFYYGAETQYGVPWNVLAGVHRVETVFSTLDPMVSSVGAIGHMQFMPKTWIGWSYPGGSDLGDADIPDDVLTDPAQIAKYGGYGVDANGDGRADPFDVQDAIYAAAGYLARNGGSPFDPQKALYAYNHDQAYVDQVMSFANRYAEGFSPISSSEGADIPYGDFSQQWIKTIEWKDPRDGSKKVGLDAQLRQQAIERDIRISPGLVMILAEKSDRAKKDEKEKEYADILQPRDMKVIVVKKTTTTTTVTPKKSEKETDETAASPDKPSGKTSAKTAAGNATAGDTKDKDENEGESTTTTTTVEEPMLFISKVTTHRGKFEFRAGYEVDETTVTNADGGTTTTVVTRPTLEGTTFKSSDALLDEALRKAHIRGKQGKMDVLKLTRMVDPNFWDERLIGDKDIFIFQSSGGAMQWPTPGFFSISSPFGNRKDPVSGESKFHAGMDIPVDVGTPVAAADDGEVVAAGKSDEAGNNIRLKHKTMDTRYLHLSKINVKVGEFVKRGQVIGESGNTGKSTGPHLHLEVIVNGNPVDPFPYFKGKSGGQK
ncbi:peptidoglycan DD-metalloendopeptidase family protein [Cohnella soli]|uniref:Peptidoglycan DD-metalloendopeptidase family protein n=1 Tax=Cohnella soli TaxID=425005 RepID=A0ABW0HNX0_9BACL